LPGDRRGGAIRAGAEDNPGLIVTSRLVRFRRHCLAPAAVAATFASIGTATAQATPSCTFTAYPGGQVQTRHTVEVDSDCVAVPDGSPDSGWVYSDETVTTTQRMHTFGIGTGFGPGFDHCAFDPLAVDCPIPLNLTGADEPYESEVYLTYAKPLQCRASATTVHVRLTLLDPSSSAQETVQGTPDGPCAGNIAITGVPAKCVSGTFKVRERVPHALVKLLELEHGGNIGFDASEINVYRLGAGAWRRIDPYRLTSPDIGEMRNGFTWKIFAAGLKPGRYQLRLFDPDFGPADYPNASATFTRC
jgi:hypothetical protein